MASRGFETPYFDRNRIEEPIVWQRFKIPILGKCKNPYFSPFYTPLEHTYPNCVLVPPGIVFNSNEISSILQIEQCTLFQQKHYYINTKSYTILHCVTYDTSFLDYQLYYCLMLAYLHKTITFTNLHSFKKDTMLKTSDPRSSLFCQFDTHDGLNIILTSYIYFINLNP